MAKARRRGKSRTASTLASCLMRSDSTRTEGFPFEAARFPPGHSLGPTSVGRVLPTRFRANRLRRPGAVADARAFAPDWLAALPRRLSRRPGLLPASLAVAPRRPSHDVPVVGRPRPGLPAVLARGALPASPHRPDETRAAWAFGARRLGRAGIPARPSHRIPLLARRFPDVHDRLRMVFPRLHAARFPAVHSGR